MWHAKERREWDMVVIPEYKGLLGRGRHKFQDNIETGVM
jgi:hypothetical protein